MVIHNNLLELKCSITLQSDNTYQKHNRQNNLQLRSLFGLNHLINTYIISWFQQVANFLQLEQLNSKSLHNIKFNKIAIFFVQNSNLNFNLMYMHKLSCLIRIDVLLIFLFELFSNIVLVALPSLLCGIFNRKYNFATVALGGMCGHFLLPWLVKW